MNPQPLPVDLLQPLALAGARLGIFARRISWYPEAASTNDLAATFAERGAAEGTVIVANAQTAGRGRHGRTWASPAGAGLYVSAVLRPPPHALPLLTIAAGVAVAEGIQAATGLATDLKWPNDIYAGGRKVAGVLAEARPISILEAGQARPGAMQHVILGFGINVMPAAYPPDVAARATSLEAELGRPVDRGVLLAECLSHLAARYDDLAAGRLEPVAAAWRQRAASLLGRPVQWDGIRGTEAGVAETIDDGGALIVRTEAGRRRVTAGEVRWTES
jgi:BirA family biotin operon repressor/biotin-[acetyl-CoA-carboxylase] ligase